MDNKNSTSQVFCFHSDKINFKSVEEKDGKNYFLEGYVSTDDLDLVNDIVTKSCMDDMTNQFSNRTIKLDFEHEAFRGKSDFESQLNKTKLPLGKSVDVIRDSKGVKVSWKMNTTWKKFDEKGNVTMTFKDLWQNVEEGYYDAFSIAYIPLSTAQQNVKGVDARLLDKINLFNVALTGNPINPGATMTNVMAKSLEWLKNKEGEMNMKNKDVKDDPAKPVEGDKPDEGAEPAEPAKPAEDAKPADDKPVEGEPAAEAEQKALKIDKDLLEIKSQIKELKDKNAVLEKEIKEYKDIVEKARPAGFGAPNNAENKGAEVKSVGPLDFIA